MLFYLVFTGSILYFKKLRQCMSSRLSFDRGVTEDFSVAIANVVTVWFFGYKIRFNYVCRDRREIFGRKSGRGRQLFHFSEEQKKPKTDLKKFTLQAPAFKFPLKLRIFRRTHDWSRPNIRSLLSSHPREPAGNSQSVRIARTRSRLFFFLLIAYERQMNSAARSFPHRRGVTHRREKKLLIGYFVMSFLQHSVRFFKILV